MEWYFVQNQFPPSQCHNPRSTPAIGNLLNLPRLVYTRGSHESLTPTAPDISLLTLQIYK